MEWLIFGAVVAAIFVADLLFERGALLRVLLSVGAAIAYCGYVAWSRGADDAALFFTAYTLEATLSFDNIFVMSLIFGALGIPKNLRIHVLTIGILSAVVLRGLFIGAGAALTARFEWLLIGAGAFLIWTGGKLLLAPSADAEVDLETNRTYRLLRRVVPVTPFIHGSRFFHAGQATPLFVAMVLIEIADIVFALDSVPAALAVTTDMSLVYTSNIFAIVGLRSLYLVLEDMVGRFEHLGKAVAAVLVFIGAKVLAHHLLHIEINNFVSLGMVLATLAAGMLFSLRGKSHD